MKYTLLLSLFFIPFFLPANHLYLTFSDNPKSILEQSEAFFLYCSSKQKDESLKFLENKLKNYSLNTDILSVIHDAWLNQCAKNNESQHRPKNSIILSVNNGYLYASTRGRNAFSYGFQVNLQNPESLKKPTQNPDISATENYHIFHANRELTNEERTILHSAVTNYGRIISPQREAITELIPNCYTIILIGMGNISIKDYNDLVPTFAKLFHDNYRQENEQILKASLQDTFEYLIKKESPAPQYGAALLILDNNKLLANQL